MSKISGQLLISGQFQVNCEISGISGQLGALVLGGKGVLPMHFGCNKRAQKTLVALILFQLKLLDVTHTYKTTACEI